MKVFKQQLDDSLLFSHKNIERLTNISKRLFNIASKNFNFYEEIAWIIKN